MTETTKLKCPVQGYVLRQVVPEGTVVMRAEQGFAPGSEKGVKLKFADELRDPLVDQILAELEEGRFSGQRRPDFAPDGAERSEAERTVLGVEFILQNRFWSVICERVLFDGKDGQPVEGFYWHHRWNIGLDTGSAALCIGTDSAGQQVVILSKAYRYVLGEVTVEAPRGMRKPDESQNPVATGVRESLEEAGVQARGPKGAALPVYQWEELLDGAELPEDSSWAVHVGRIDPDSGALRQFPALVLYGNVTYDESLIPRVRDLTEAPHGTIAMTVDDLLLAILTGRITCGYTRSAVLSALLAGVLKSSLLKLDKAQLCQMLG